VQRKVEIPDGIPRGAKRVEAYESATEIVVCGTPPDDMHLPEDQRHNCDEMGCGQSHVIYRFRKEGGPGYGSDCCPKCGPGIGFQTERSTFKRCDKCSALF
jgi:hypothetical protein